MRKTELAEVPASDRDKSGRTHMMLLDELKALPTARSAAARRDHASLQATGKVPSDASAQQLPAANTKETSGTPAAGAGEGEAAQTAHKPCDAECEHMKRVGRERMKALRAQIDADFKGMVSFGADAAYVPPVESIEEQVKDGSLYNNGKVPGSEEAKEPPSSFAGGALIAADPAASQPVLPEGEVKEVEHDVAAETPSADDLLQGIQHAEAQAHSNPLAPASSAADDTEGAGAAGAGAAVAAAPDAASKAASAPVPAAAPRPAVAGTPSSAAARPGVECIEVASAPGGRVCGTALPVSAGAGPTRGASQAAQGAEHATSPRPGQFAKYTREAADVVRSLEPASPSEPPAEAAAAAPDTSPAADVLDNFPRIGEAAGAERDAADAHAAHAGRAAARGQGQEQRTHPTPFDKAFSFLRDTDNPVRGSPARGARPATDVLRGGVHHDPLDADGFLKGFWGPKGV